MFSFLHWLVLHLLMPPNELVDTEESDLVDKDRGKEEKEVS